MRAAWFLRRSSMVVALWLTLGLLGGVANAQDSVLNAPEGATTEDAAPVPEERDRRDLWMLFGVSGGWLGNGDANAFLIGGEVSFLWAERDPNHSMFQSPRDGSLAFGAVLDAVWVSNPSHFRAMLGGELVGFFGEALNAGLEVGATFHSRGDVVGFRARGFFTIVWPVVYLGLDYHGRASAEAGLLLKIPFRI